MNDFLLNSIIGIQHQIRALDCSLEALVKQMTPRVNPDNKSADPRNPVCPKCSESVIDVSLNGQKPREFQCVSTVCDFRGPLDE